MICNFKMQENNNFESIIRTWRRLSGELVETESTALASMSGDSHSNQIHKKEESDLLVPERPRLTGDAPAGVTLVTAETADSTKEEKKESLKNDSDDKDAAGDTNDKDLKENGDNKSEKDYLENPVNGMDKSTETQWPSNKLEDKVDSVFLRQPPPHKSRSTASTAEEEDCGLKCLYYTLQCCDCVLM